MVHGFSACNYCYYLDGYAQPISIRNSRMEKSDAILDTYGIYIKGVGIRAYIESLNVYNIKYPIYNETSNDLYINGTCTFNGTSQHSPLIFPKWKFSILPCVYMLMYQQI